MNFPENITKEQLEATIDSCIILHTHAERNRKILKRRLIDGLTHEQLAEEIDELMECVSVINPKLYNSVLEKIRGVA